MKNPRAYDSYFGGKAGNGTYQAIINHIPEHNIYYSIFAGNDGVYQNIKTERAVLVDLDPTVCMAWDKLKIPGLTVYNDCAFEMLSIFKLKRKGENAFIFLDPPYIDSTRRSSHVYKFEFNSAVQHIALLKIITQLKQNIMICSYPNELYDMWLSDWKTHDYMSMTHNGLAQERIYMNYDISTLKLQDYRYIGGGFREREKYTRIKNNMLKKLRSMSEVQRQSILEEIKNELL